MKLKKTNRNWILFATLYVSVIVCIFGSIFGTYAWYQYSSRAGVSYSGTAIGDSDGMQIGLISDRHLASFAASDQITEDTSSISGKYVYWVKGDGVNSDIINQFEEELGYAGSEIGPSSSGSYVTGDDFSLKTAPIMLEKTEFNPADKNRYSFIPMAIRTGANSNIYLQSSSIECDDEEGQIEKAVRVSFVNPLDSSTNYIYNPSSLFDGHTAVGGILNLNAESDIYYDFEGNKEHIYGEVESYTYNDSPYDGTLDVLDEYVTTFTANHHKGVYGVSYVPKTAEYFGSDSVLGQKPITYTGSNGGIAQVYMTVYLEGWDESCINAEIENSYSLNLEFTFGPRG